MAIVFDHFSPQAFERMVQALCVRVLGPGVIVFGAGPDGGREATFEGEVPFPSTDHRWKGYIVVQAKCRERLRHTSDDAEWVCDQLKHDLEKFVDLKRSLRKPRYYILATNVTLSPQENTGGKAKVDAVFASFKDTLGLAEWATWSADELRAHLENAEDIRRAYTAWLTPSDVLASLIDSLKRPDLSRLVPLALARDLRHERDVRLRDAGQETDKAIYLEDVFVDLPLVPDGPPKESASPSAPRALASLLERAADKLNHVEEMLATNSAGVMFAARLIRQRAPAHNRVVLLGGPGQGKSTLGQFLVQLERARMLSACSASKLNPQTRDLIGPILERADAEGLSITRPLRFPIRADLPGFADALSRFADQSEPTTLLAYLTERLSRALALKVEPDDLRTWLGTCPSLIVLDGLDEVPPTSNRIDVIKAIDALWDDLTLVNADALVVVTTRPQGYNEDLDPRYWQHWALAPLAAADTLRYAGRLADVRVSDPERRESILGELRRACDDPATSALLTSPLQVAILFGLAFLQKSIPRDRWELFSRYYQLLRDREAQKPGSLIPKYQRQIDALHQEAGFVLHVAAETAGKTNAYLTPSQFRALIVRLLSDEDFERDEIIDLSERLLHVATDRLVLLAARVEGRIAFDVRSLQEFMAAAQLFASSTVPLTERLRSIAESAHWQHVFRISASRIFSVAELGSHRADIVGICHALDSGDFGEENRLTRARGTACPQPADRWRRCVGSEVSKAIHATRTGDPRPGSRVITPGARSTVLERHVGHLPRGNPGTPVAGDDSGSASGMEGADGDPSSRSGLGRRPPGRALASARGVSARTDARRRFERLDTGAHRAIHTSAA